MMPPLSPCKLALAAAMFLSATSIQAATYTNNGGPGAAVYNPSGGSTWNTAAFWANNAVTAGNTYQLNADSARVSSNTPYGTSFTVSVGGTPTAWAYYAWARDFGTGTPTGGDTYTFGGDKIILTEKTAFRGYGRNTTTTGNWEMQNGSFMVLNAGGSGATTAWNGTISTAGTTAIGLITNNATALTINASITGTGTLNLVTSGGSVANLNLNGDISGFTGTLFLSNSSTKNTNTGAFSIANSATFATLQLNWESPLFHYDLSTNNVSFASLVLTNNLGVNNTLGIGTYDMATLNSLTGNGIFSGTGTITVVPEPSTYALGLMGLFVITLAVRRRRRLEA